LSKRSDETSKGGAAGEAAGEAAGDELDTPVDLWWWLAFFHCGKRCGKLGGDALFGWRQHPRQHTRTHGRLSLDSLRRVKAHFVMRGPGAGATQLQVWSTGHTLGAWEKELRAAGASDVLAVSWKPGAPPPEGWRRLTKRKAAAEEPGGRHGVVRLFAFGKEKAREKVRTSVRDWDAQLDWFVA